MSPDAHAPVLLTGASGLLGTWLRRTVPVGTPLVPLAHRARVPGATDAVTADLRDRAAVREVVQQVRPTLVVHAAYAVDEASIVTATANVVVAAASVGAAVLFVSTDAVFSGNGVPRAETDTPDPVADYGRWKAEAEATVAAGPAGSSVVRLPLVVSLDPGDHVVRRIRAGAAQGVATTWFVDELRQPARAADLAAALWAIAALGTDERVGAWHLPGPETLSRYEIAERIVARLGLPSDVIAPAASGPVEDRPRHLDLLAGRAVDGIGWAPGPVLT